MKILIRVTIIKIRARCPVLSAGVLTHGSGLPVIVYRPSNVPQDQVLKAVLQGYMRYYGEAPSQELIFSWRATLPKILKVSDGYPILIEYPILDGLERVDYIVVGRRKALIVEAKAWTGRYRRLGSYLVHSPTSGEVRVDPCYQLENYIAKFKYLHTAHSKLGFEGLVLTVGFRYSDGCRIAEDEGALSSAISRLGGPGGSEEVDAIVNGKFQISKSLIEFVRDHKEELLRKSIDALLGGGYGLTEQQLLIVNRALEALENGEDKAFFVHGVSGSGKTLVALTLFFEALSRNYKVLLTYKNNRLLNTVREVLGPRLRGFLLFYSVGPPRYRGVAERNFPVSRYGQLDLIIYDEAQRMSDENIEFSMRRSRVKVYLYDEEQVLIGYESGYTDNFTSKARGYGVRYELYELPRPARVSYAYLQAIRNLLTNGGLRPHFTTPEFRVYGDVRDMLEDLRRKHKEGKKVALVAAFTETPGNKGDRRAPDNLRIGYPLCRKYRNGKCVERSDLNIYRGTNLRIYWLMHEREEYPRYWMGLLDPLSFCASVYGAQGFEAEYVGVVWGRDLVWRNGRWEVNPSVITDYVGGRDSLRSIARRDRGRAYRLLVNRYMVLLTRGTKGVYVFAEDEETSKHLIKQAELSATRV